MTILVRRSDIHPSPSLVLPPAIPLSLLHEIDLGVRALRHRRVKQPTRLADPWDSSFFGVIETPPSPGRSILHFSVFFIAPGQFSINHISLRQFIQYQDWSFVVRSWEAERAAATRRLNSRRSSSRRGSQRSSSSRGSRRRPPSSPVAVPPHHPPPSSPPRRRFTLRVRSPSSLLDPHLISSPHPSFPHRLLSSSSASSSSTLLPSPSVRLPSPTPFPRRDLLPSSPEDLSLQENVSSAW